MPRREQERELRHKAQAVREALLAALLALDGAE